MKCSIISFVLIIILWNSPSVNSQTLAVPAGTGNIVITMKQDNSRGWGGGVNSPYTVTLEGNGTVIYDGMDEGKAVSRYEPPVKVVRRSRITQKQFKDLVTEFYKIDFFSLEDSYAARINEDGTRTIIADGGLADVVISISINGKTKSVTNINFAPESLVRLQRKIYELSNISRFIKIPPYWMNFFPDERFPPRGSKPPPEKKAFVVEHRKIARNSPPKRKANQIDLYRKWGFFTPCVTTRREVEKLLGKSISTEVNGPLITYNSKEVKIRAYYGNRRTNTEVCGGGVTDNTIILYSVIPIKDVRLSDLRLDLSQFTKGERFGGSVKSYNNRKGLYIETEIVEFQDGEQHEMVTSIQFNQQKS